MWEKPYAFVSTTYSSGVIEKTINSVRTKQVIAAVFFKKKHKPKM